MKVDINERINFSTSRSQARENFPRSAKKKITLMYGTRIFNVCLFHFSSLFPFVYLLYQSRFV